MISIYRLKFVSGKSYVGQSNNYTQRYTEHVRTLLLGKHHNILVQNEYNKCKTLPSLELLNSTRYYADEHEDYYIIRYGSLNIRKPTYIPKLHEESILSTKPNSAPYRVKKSPTT